ncbi:hypothetical protein EYF80_005105 [Liparis tanakae]|uniref:Uncharacterized protein n=1 Tax=Liparis tanakae TaxID=230148 RepID=A0A4Z2J3A5_9TELE|nr:hypothetical protein EYF80_005105 [Liparis tanakae]
MNGSEGSRAAQSARASDRPLDGLAVTRSVWGDDTTRCLSPDPQIHVNRDELWKPPSPYTRARGHVANRKGLVFAGYLSARRGPAQVTATPQLICVITATFAHFPDNRFPPECHLKEKSAFPLSGLNTTAASVDPGQVLPSLPKGCNHCHTGVLDSLGPCGGPFPPLEESGYGGVTEQVQATACLRVCEPDQWAPDEVPSASPSETCGNPVLPSSSPVMPAPVSGLVIFHPAADTAVEEERMVPNAARYEAGGAQEDSRAWRRLDGALVLKWGRGTIWVSLRPGASLADAAADWLRGPPLTDCRRINGVNPNLLANWRLEAQDCTRWPRPAQHSLDQPIPSQLCSAPSSLWPPCTFTSCAFLAPAASSGMVEEEVEEEEGNGRKAMDLASERKENGWTHTESAGCHGGLLSEGHRRYMKPTELNEIAGANKGSEHPTYNRVRTLEESKGQLREEDSRLRRGTCLGSWAVEHGASWLHWNREEEEKKYQIPVCLFVPEIITAVAPLASRDRSVAMCSSALPRSERNAQFKNRKSPLNMGAFGLNTKAAQAPQRPAEVVVVVVVDFSGDWRGHVVLALSCEWTDYCLHLNIRLSQIPPRINLRHTGLTGCGSSRFDCLPGAEVKKSRQD